ncbi:MAG TPA: ABC transporter ATP-binding protein [Gammaproteobacteria bacterium]|nr:ABC transporter ATP-binding protein [Gammaproteobacteria bacterium]
MSDVIVFEGVGKRYGKLEPLSDLSFTVAEGEVVALLGHNGAGKTTSMKLILGLIAASSGTVRTFGGDPFGANTDALRCQLGYLPENVSFYEQLSGREVLTYFARLKRTAPAQIGELLARVGLAAAANRRVKTYSKGMRQRLGLAQALLGRPRLVLLDEPTTGLDPAATRDFYAMVKELRDGGCAVLLSSHVLPGIEPYIDRALILGDGRPLALGSIAELRQEAALPLIIRATGAWPAEAWNGNCWEGAAVDLVYADTQRLELKVPAGDKMAVLRQLSSSAAVHDLELLPPTLESLYTHFSSYRQEAAA